MRQSKITIKAYRAVLHHGILCNAIALGLCVAPAMAEDIVLNGIQFATAEGLNIGHAGDTVTINSTGDGLRAISNGVGVNAVSKFANITADTINIASSSAGGDAGVWIQNNTTPDNNPTSFSTVNLTANDIDISGPTGLVVMSQGRINIAGNTTITGLADNFDAILTRGFAQTKINEDGENTVKMTGNIDFNFDEDTSGTPINALVDITLNSGESFWTGNTVVSYDDGVPPAEASYMEVSDATITLKNGAMWNATKINNQVDYYHTALNNLKSYGGVVQANETGAQMTVENLTVGASGLTINDGEMTVSDSLISAGQTFVAEGASLVVDTTDGASFANGSADKGGAIYNFGGAEEIYDDVNEEWTINRNIGTVNIDGAVFDGNTASDQGGAIYNSGDMTLSNITFTSNQVTGDSWTSMGGAVYNSGTDDLDVGDYYMTSNGILTINNSTFGDKNDAAKGNIALRGGALAMSDSWMAQHGQITLNSTNFYGNKALGDADSGVSPLGGAIYNSDGTIIVNGATEFAGNKAEGYAAEGGAIYNADTITFNDAVTFSGNTVKDTDGANGGLGGAVSNTKIMTFKGLATFTGNKALVGTDNNYDQPMGGAVHNDGTIDFQNGAVFAENEAKYGGAIGVLDPFGGTVITTVTDGTFTNNIAGDEGGAIFQYGTGVVTNINAKNSDVVFSGNRANGEANDIVNYRGTINLNAATGRSISMDGGITGPSGTLNINSAVEQTGLVDVSSYIVNHTVNVDAGELHLSKGEADGANLTGSTITVNNGATLNSIDNVINNYSDYITLQNGANIKGDLDYVAGVADTYSADNGASVNYKLANALGADVQYGAQKEIQITNAGATINDGAFAWYADSDHGLSVVSGGEGTGTILVTGQSGGINSAVDVTDSSNQDIEYTLTAATETFDGNGGTDNLIENANFAITGNGSDENNSNKLVLANDLVVGDTSTLALESVVLKHDDTSETVEKIDNQSTLNVSNSTLDVNVSNSGTATVSSSTLAADKVVENKVGATMTILNSQIDANLNNAGTLISDPTTYTATVSNTGTASFDADTFTGTSVLVNNGTANLTNGVTFVNGASIQGTGTTNLASGTTHFNNTASSNTVNLASGADFDGTLTGTGTLDTRNDTIDNVTGSVAGGDLYVDANLTGNGAIDTFAGGSNGATIKQINLTESSYGTAKSYSLNAGGADVDANVKVTGATNYYTKVDANGGNVVFSDKLMNTSGMHEQIGDWGDGNYISASTNYDTTTDSYSDTTGQTVGQALTLLDNEVANVNNTIGSMAALDTSNGVLDNTASVATNLQNLDTALNDVRVNAAARNQLTLNQAVAYTDERVSELDKELSSGIASAVALSSVAVSNVGRGEMSVGAGYGYYNGRSAAAFGAAMGLSNRWSVNAGAGISDADVSFRAGTNYKFKLF